MGIIHRIKKTIAGEKNESSHPPDEIIVRNAAVQKPKTEKLTVELSTKDPSKRGFMGGSKLSAKQPRQVDPHETQQRHVERLFDISNQLMEESLKNQYTVPVTQQRAAIEHEVPLAQKQQHSSQLPVEKKPKSQTQSETSEETPGPHTIVTAQESCSLVEVFADLPCCGFNDAIGDYDRGIPSRTGKEMKRGHRKPKLLRDSNMHSIPREISFSRTESFENSNYILLSEIEDDGSLRASMMSRLRCGRSRTTSFSTTRVYLEPPQRGGTRTRSLESRALGI